MRLWIFSCLQLDHPGQEAFPGDVAIPDADVTVVAGDLHRPLSRSVESLAPVAARMPVVYVPGNRDYYQCLPMREEAAKAREAAARLGIHLLDDEGVTLGGVRFLGATLWTDYALYGAPEAAMLAAAREVNDHRVIQAEAGVPFTPADALARHRAGRLFLATALASPHPGPTVVVTHHAPHQGSLHPRANDSLSPAFASDLTPLLSGPSAPDLWVHGATHQNCDHAVGRTRILSNSRGYPRENPAFDPGMVVDLGRGA